MSAAFVLSVWLRAIEHAAMSELTHSVMLASCQSPTSTCQAHILESDNFEW